MIKLPNGTISRTLAEQVGFNSTKIAEIIKFLNESGLKDLVINLESVSGTLSTDQYAIAELSPSYMVYDGGVLYKVYEDSDYIDYFLLQEQVAVDSDMEVNHFRIRVERDSRNYALETVNIFTSYNKSQIDSILSALNSAIDAKAPLAGANFTGPITAPSIVENMSGYSFTKQTGENATLSYYYAGVVKTGNKITFVIFATLNLDSTQVGYQNLGKFNLPADILSKLYPFSGDVLAIDFVGCFIGTGMTGAVNSGYYVHKHPDGISIYLARPGLSANTTYGFRIEQTFLLSDNLAS